MTHVSQRNGRNKVRLGLKQLIGKQRDATPFFVGVQTKRAIALAHDTIFSWMRLMEPLGIAQDIVEPAVLKRWADYPIQHRYTDYSDSIRETAHHAISPFPCQPSLNNKLALW